MQSSIKGLEMERGIVEPGSGRSIIRWIWTYSNSCYADSSLLHTTHQSINPGTMSDDVNEA